MGLERSKRKGFWGRYIFVFKAKHDLVLKQGIHKRKCFWALFFVKGLRRQFDESKEFQCVFVLEHGHAAKIKKKKEKHCGKKEVS